MSPGNVLLIQFYSATGSYDGQDFTYSITYKFVRKPTPATTSSSATKRQRPSEGGSVGEADGESRLISLRPVNFSALNIDDGEGCNCDFADRIGNFKSWFIVLVVLGVISFAGATAIVVALLVRCARTRAAEKKLIQQTPKRSTLYFKGSTD